MNITYDVKKNTLNSTKHGISLGRALEFDFDTALVKQDERYDYKEKRYQAIGYLGNRLHVLIFTPRKEGRCE